MKVAIAGQPARVQCDGCAKLEVKRPNIIVVRGERSTRPEEGSRDRFFDIVLPPSVSPVTGRPDGRYKGCGREDHPSVLVPLHLCPSCAEKIRKCVQFSIGKCVFKRDDGAPLVSDAIQISALGDLMMLPPGRLREHLLVVKSKNIFPTMGNA